MFHIGGIANDRDLAVPEGAKVIAILADVKHNICQIYELTLIDGVEHMVYSGVEKPYADIIKLTEEEKTNENK